MVFQGSFSLVYVSMKGAKPVESSSMVARRLTKSKPSGRVKIQLMQCGQKKWRGLPWRALMTKALLATGEESVAGECGAQREGAAGHALTAGAVAGHGEEGWRSHFDSHLPANFDSRLSSRMRQLVSFIW